MRKKKGDESKVKTKGTPRKEIVQPDLGRRDRLSRKRRLDLTGGREEKAFFPKGEKTISGRERSSKGREKKRKFRRHFSKKSCQ